jgi:hypothetical protein
MFVDLLMWAGCMSAAVSAREPGALAVLARGWAEAALERERRATLAAVIGCLLPSVCVAERDAWGRVRFIGPAATAPGQAAWDVLG